MCLNVHENPRLFYSNCCVLVVKPLNRNEAEGDPFFIKTRR